MGLDPDSRRSPDREDGFASAHDDLPGRTQQLIGSLIEKIQKAREVEDFHSARDYCREWLDIEPRSERALEILAILDATLSREREDRVIVNRCRDLFDQRRYRETLDLLETLDPTSPLATEVKRLQNQARQIILENSTDKRNARALEEILRLLDHGHIDLAMNRLDSLDLPDEGEALILRRKLNRARENRATEKLLIVNLNTALENADIETARVWLGMITELNPRTDIFDVLRKTLSPELYENLTSRITLT